MAQFEFKITIGTDMHPEAVGSNRGLGHCNNGEETMAGKYNGMKRAADWKGKRVELVREIGNGYCQLPAGYVGTITQQGSTGLTFEGEPCGCCKVKPRVTRLSYFSVRLVA